ncbi:MAG: cell division protein FtsX [Bacteroidota bacterium]|jgi:cell division transport system permease protein
MNDKNEKYSHRKIRSSFFSTIVSLSLVLFVLGLLGLVVLNAKKLSDYVKENIGLSIILKDSIRDAEFMSLRKQLDVEPFVKKATFVTKEQAAESLKKDLGEDFVKFLGYNPLLSSFDIKLNAAYANADSLQAIEKKLLLNNNVKEVYYQKSLVNVINDNVRKIGIVLLSFCLLLSVIAIALINNTIRLYIYSKRFIIRTMQLVGATTAFISRPFIIKSVWNGFYSALITIAMLMGLIYTAQNNFPELIGLNDIKLFIQLFAMVMIAGVGITFLSTYFAVKKYLKIQTDDLYQL